MVHYDDRPRRVPFHSSKVGGLLHECFYKESVASETACILICGAARDRIHVGRGSSIYLFPVLIQDISNSIAKMTKNFFENICKE